MRNHISVFCLLVLFSLFFGALWAEDTMPVLSDTGQPARATWIPGGWQQTGQNQFVWQPAHWNVVQAPAPAPVVVQEPVYQPSTVMIYAGSGYGAYDVGNAAYGSYNYWGGCSRPLCRPAGPCFVGVNNQLCAHIQLRRPGYGY